MATTFSPGRDRALPSTKCPETRRGIAHTLWRGTPRRRRGSPGILPTSENAGVDPSLRASEKRSLAGNGRADAARVAHPSLDVRVRRPGVVFVERGRAELPEDLSCEFAGVAVRGDLRRGVEPAKDGLQGLLPFPLRHLLVHRRDPGLHLHHRCDEVPAESNDLLLFLVHGRASDPILRPAPIKVSRAEVPLRAADPGSRTRVPATAPRCESRRYEADRHQHLEAH